MPPQQNSANEPDSHLQAQAQAQSMAVPTRTSSGNGNQIKRLASKPLKLAASTFRPLTKSSSSSIGNANASATTSSDALTPAENSGSKRGLSVKRRHRHMKSKDASALTPAQLASAARGPRKPLDGEEPAAWLRVRVVKADDLVAKDRNGTSDPFISLLLPPSTRHQTPVVKKSLNPSFPSDGSTFDFPIYLSLGGVVGGRGLEGVVWDKDLMRKEYMGEVTIPLSQWFPSGEVQLWSDNLPLLTRKLLSTRRRHKVSGDLSLQIGFLEPKNATGQEDALRKVKMVYEALSEQANVGRDYFGVLGVPAHEGIGTVKMRHRRSSPAIDPSNGGALAALSATSSSTIFSPFSRKKKESSPDSTDDLDGEESGSDSLSDDGLTSDSSGEEFESGADDDDVLSTLHESPMFMDDTVQTIYNAQVGLPPPPPKTKTSTDDKVSKSTSGGGWLGAKALRSSARKSSFNDETPDEIDSPGISVPGTPGTGLATPGGTKTKRPIFKRSKSRAASKKSSTRDFNFDANTAADIQGIVVMEIQSANDLPKLKNALRFSFDMDPFVVISFGKKVFRTRVIRHQLNPVWDEKLLFHVRRNENAYTIQFAVLDWDKVSGNDMVGTCTLPLTDLMNDAPQADPETGLYAADEDGKHESKTFTLPVSTAKEMAWESKHSPRLTVRAKYEPYDALRQKFWRQYASQYDVDETGKISHTELSAMLDSLGSTLTHQTIDNFFSRFGKSAESDELTLDEVVQCMEREVNKSKSERAKVSMDDSRTSRSGSRTPNMAPEPAGHGLDETGPDVSSPVDADALRDKILKSVPNSDDRNDGHSGPGNLQPLSTGSAIDVPEVKLERPATVVEGRNEIPLLDGAGTMSPMSGLSDNEDSESSAEDRERVINIRSCPLCHRRRLKRKSEQDIITHLAICASSDWSRMDRIVTSNYVTSSQAQRKFFTKLIGKVTSGAYSLGANSANILVQDRMTGQLQEEKMAVYVRLGIRVLYKGARGGMASARAKRLLKSMSVKQGIKYNSPESAADILPFIAFHALNLDEILDPLESFKTFNEFFYRKLKPSARPIAEPENEGRLVSCADCRMMAFDTVTSATSIWIKGRDFSVAKLLGPNYKDVADRYEGGALGIFRLAPQDYHRFHSPVSGTVGKMTMIEGEYYTVNPQAIRTSLDVYGENARKVVPIQSDDFGLVMTVWVGAMMVGSILTSVTEGQKVNRADELGYFAFGGSTIVLLFEKGQLEWDEDLLANGRASIETLVRVGSGIGRKSTAITPAAGDS